MAERCKEWLRRWREVNDWETLEDEIPNRTWRDGETFIRFFENPDGKPGDVSPAEFPFEVRRRLRELDVDERDLGRPELPPGMTEVRLLPPEQIRDPSGVISHGVLTLPDDVQTVLGYLWAPNPDDPRSHEFVSSRDVIQTKLGVDSDMKRGRTLVEIILRRSKQYEQWLDSRIALNHVRSAVALIRKVKSGSPAQVSSIASAHDTERDTTRSNRQKTLRSGSVLTPGPNIEYDFLSPNLQASDAQKDGRSILLTMSAATGMPEYIFTGDAANANFASTLVAESPGVREFQSWQDYFGPIFAAMHRRALLDAARAGAIEGLSEDMFRRGDVTLAVQFPPMIAREEKEHAEANEIRHRNAVLSKEGWARDEGIDYDVEKERLERERREALDFSALAPPPSGNGDGGDEGEEEEAEEGRGAAGWPDGHRGDAGASGDADPAAAEELTEGDGEAAP